MNSRLVHSLFDLFGALTFLLFLSIFFFPSGEFPSILSLALVWCFGIWLIIALWGALEFLAWLIFGWGDPL